MCSGQQWFFNLEMAVRYSADTCIKCAGSTLAAALLLQQLLTRLTRWARRDYCPSGHCQYHLQRLPLQVYIELISIALPRGYSLKGFLRPPLKTGAQLPGVGGVCNTNFLAPPRSGLSRGGGPSFAILRPGFVNGGGHRLGAPLMPRPPLVRRPSMHSI